jgi:TolB-like protein
VRCGLGVRYVLEGSARKAGRRVCITAQLIDALSGTHLWADRFDGSLEDVFELQDQVAKVVLRRRRKSRVQFQRFRAPPVIPPSITNSAPVM